MHIKRHSAWHCPAITCGRSSIVIKCNPKSVNLPPPSRALCKTYHVLLAGLLQKLLLQGCIGGDGERDVHVGPHRGLHRAAVETIRAFNGVIDLQSTGLSICCCGPSPDRTTGGLQALTGRLVLSNLESGFYRTIGLCAQRP